MSDIIKELWYGNINPAERRVKKNSEYGRELHKLTELTDAFRAALSEEGKEQFETLSDTIWHMAAIAEEEAFAQGFRLGAQITLASVSEHIGDFEPFR